MKNQETKATLKVRVPATSANLGAGFDVLGLALDLCNNFSLTSAEQTSITISGHGVGMACDETNLFYRACDHLFRHFGQATPPLAISMDLAVPLGSGLGSSATAVVGGLMAANALLDEPLTKEELLPHAILLEHGHHPDNVAPALLGGLVVNAADGDQAVALKLPFPDDLHAVVFTPNFAMDTVEGRKLMPPNYSRADAVYNTSRVGLFVAALSMRRYELLRVAMQDRLHQPYRTELFPLLPHLIAAALAAGACGASLSGGGSSVIALATDHLDEVAAALQNTATADGMSGISRQLAIDHEGAQAFWQQEEDTDGS